MVSDGTTRCYKFEAVNGIFLDLEAGVYTTTQPSLGLIDQVYSNDDSEDQPGKSHSEPKPWQRLKTYIGHLNSQAPKTVSYKILYLVRHGFGYHNEYMAKVGHEAWNNHWSHLDGNGSITWADSDLNQIGIAQARKLSDFWVSAIKDDLIPIPDSVYSSPLSRCLETTRLVFEPVLLHDDHSFQPRVKEGLRERLTNHTCDRRRSKSWIQESYPNYILDADLSENDELWTGKTEWETASEHEVRKQVTMERIWKNDIAPFVAVVTHSYAISAILGVLGLPQFRVKEGNCVAIMVKGEKI